MTRWHRIRQCVATALHRRTVLGLCLLISVIVPFISDPVWAQQFTFRQFREQDGLNNLAVTCLLQDRAGYIWICTENGLFRYDGSDFERFGEAEGIEDTNIRSAIEDPSGHLWVGTSHDLYLGDGHQFHSIRPDGRVLALEQGSEMAALGPDRMLVVNQNQLLELHASPKDHLWKADPFFSADQLKEFPSLQRLNSVAVDPAGRVMLGCSDTICTVDHGRITVWEPRTGVPQDTWLSWLVDRDGRLWVRGLRHLVMQEVGASRFQSRNPPHVQLTSQLLNVPLIQDQDGRIVTRTAGGLARWEQGHWVEFAGGNGIPSETIVALLVERSGALWLGTPGHGVSRWLGYGHFESWTTGQGLGSNVVWATLNSADRGIVVGGEGGCQRIDLGLRRALPCQIEGLPRGEVQLLAERADRSLWIGMTTGKLFRVPAQSHRAVLVGSLPPMRVLYTDSRGRMWVCTTSGVYVAEPGSNQLRSVPEMAELGEVSDAVEDAHGVMWFASLAGLIRLAEGHWTVLKIDDEHARAGFASITVAQDGSLWAGGSSHGLLHLHLEGDQVDRTEWAGEPMLAHASILFTKPDRRGWIWVGTDSGVAVFDGSVWRKFAQGDGLIWNDTNQGSFWSDADGSIWVGTSGGITHITRPEGLMDALPLDLRITHANLGNEALDGLTEHHIPWDQNSALSLHLADLEYGEARDLTLKVRLRGLSDAWLETHDRELHYQGLGPGHYQFEATVTDHAHHRSSGLVSLKFEVLPPWWRTRWFEALAVVCAFGLLVAAWHWRMRKLRAHKRTLERQLKEHEALLERATRDALTGLWNRTAILEILAQKIEQAKLERTVLAVAIIDVDHFKRINDTCGHLGGDEVLRTLGARLGSQIRASDSLGRFGGEELLLVMPGMPSQRPSLPVERLREAISEMSFFHEGAQIKVTASFGMAWLMPDSDIPENLLGRADAALYSAKNAGRNRVGYADPEWHAPLMAHARQDEVAIQAEAIRDPAALVSPAIDWKKWFRQVNAS